MCDENQLGARNNPGEHFVTCHHRQHLSTFCCHLVVVICRTGISIAIIIALKSHNRFFNWQKSTLWRSGTSLPALLVFSFETHPKCRKVCVDRPQWLLNTPCHWRVLPNNDNCYGFSLCTNMIRRFTTPFTTFRFCNGIFYCSLFVNFSVN